MIQVPSQALLLKDTKYPASNSAPLGSHVQTITGALPYHETGLSKTVLKGLAFTFLMELQANAQKKCGSHALLLHKILPYL